MPRTQDLLALLHDMGNRLGGDLSLAAVAKRAGWSRFHLHRELRAAIGETPKQYTTRLRLARAAALLAKGDVAIGDVAATVGFSSHATFTRAFRKRFGCTPGGYRERALVGASAASRAQHLALTNEISPCIALFRMTHEHSSRGASTMPILSIERQERAEQPVLLIRRRTARAELVATIGECFGLLYGFGQKAGVAVVGRPTVRYLATGPGLWTIEACKPIAGTAVGEGEIETAALPGGTLAVGVHAGPYDQLQTTYAAIERWIEANGYQTAGAPWEVYINDPAEAPDPKDWRTEVCWPIAKS